MRPSPPGSGVPPPRGPPRWGGTPGPPDPYARYRYRSRSFWEAVDARRRACSSCSCSRGRAPAAGLLRAAGCGRAGCVTRRPLPVPHWRPERLRDWEGWACPPFRPNRFSLPLPDLRPRGLALAPDLDWRGGGTPDPGGEGRIGYETARRTRDPKSFWEGTSERWTLGSALPPRGASQPPVPAVYRRVSPPGLRSTPDNITFLRRGTRMRSRKM